MNIKESLRIENLSITELLTLVEAIAAEISDGHYTILSFTTNYQFMFGTPDLDSGKGREQLENLSQYKTLKEALVREVGIALMSLEKV